MLDLLDDIQILLSRFKIHNNNFFAKNILVRSIELQYPTKALAPLMLEDYRKVMVERRGEEEQFTADHIGDCMKKGT